MLSDPFTINTIIMLIAFFLIKSKIKILIVWFLSCFVPFFMFVYDGEQRNLEMAWSMGEDISMLKWYFGISIISLFWTLIPFLVALILFLLLKFISKKCQ